MVTHVRSSFELDHNPERVQDPFEQRCYRYRCFLESGCLKVQPKAGDKLHQKLNITTNSIANKYREGKLQRTLKREFKRT